jgi:hypothetical protein
MHGALQQPGNFWKIFCRHVLTQDFTPFGANGVIMTVPATALIVPAVLVGNRFATRVTIESETSLLVDVPASAAPVNSVPPVFVFNPDGQRSIASAPFIYVTPLTDITRLTREERMLSLGASPRGTVALFRAARAAAVLEGRDFVTPDDVKGIAPAVLRHRIALSPELEVEGRTADDVLASLLDRVRVPE